jgi:hypothetical protein
MVMSQSVQQTGTTQWWSYQIQLLNTPLSKLKSEYLMWEISMLPAKGIVISQQLKLISDFFESVVA